MKLLLLTLLLSFCSVSAGGKWLRLMAAQGLLGGGMNGGLFGGMNGQNPGMMPGGLNPPMVAGGGTGFAGQPQFAQFVPGLPGFPGPAPNMVPGNGATFMGLNPVQQALLGIKPPLPPRLRRETMKPGIAIQSTVDTQIPAPTDATTIVCDDDEHHEAN